MNYSGGAEGVAVYAGQSNRGLLWRIGRPSNTVLNQVLKPGMNFLYAKIAVTQEGETTYLNTAVTEFYRFDEDFQLTLEISNAKNLDWAEHTVTETGVAQNEERVITVVLDEAKVKADTDETKAEKIARYQAMLNACYERTSGGFYYFVEDWNPAVKWDNFSITGRSFAMPTEKLGQPVSSTPQTAKKRRARST